MCSLKSLSSTVSLLARVPLGSSHHIGGIASTMTRGMRRSSGHREERIVTNEDGSIIAAWHPEPKFPYKYTKPVPRQHDMSANVSPSQIQ